jgi:transposase
MQSTTIAVDVAKSVFEVAVSHHPGSIRRRHRFTRRRFARFLAEQPPATVVMEACGMAHAWGREAQARGHTVRLLPPRDVRPYVRGNKTDRSDAKALLEAHRNQAIQPVPVKSVEQHALTGLHRLRQAWVATRTSRLNTIRGLLRELGLVIPVGSRQVVPRVWELVSEADSGVPPLLRPVLGEAAREVTELERRIGEVEAQLQAVARHSPLVHSLRTIPGVGLLTATAIVASVGDLKRFPSARHFASSLGLTPRESSSGNVRRLGRITKRGDPYLRTLLIHGARSLLHHAKRTPRPDRLRAWALERERARGHNKAAVAVANKLARLVWATAVREGDYRPQPSEEACA